MASGKPITSTTEPLTPIVFHILMALADGPLHGYAIMQAVEEAAGPGLATGPGTIYGSLSRMEEAGLVREAAASEADAEPASGRGRPRKYFAVTPAGRDAARVEALRLEHLARMARSKNLLVDETGS